MLRETGRKDRRNCLKAEGRQNGQEGMGGGKNKTMSRVTRFTVSENAFEVLAMLKTYVLRYGIPRGVYADLGLTSGSSRPACQEKGRSGPNGISQEECKRAVG